jgi:hypothetical protein
MPVIDYLEHSTKRIYLAVGVRTYHPVEDIYQEIRALRRTDEALRWFPVPVTAAGNVPKGGGEFTPRYAIFRNGWRVVPEDTSHVLVITGEQITDVGGGGPECMDFAPLSATSKVIVNYKPPAAEVIEVSTGGGADWTPTQRTQILTGINNMDAAISSRATAADVWAHTDAVNVRERLLAMFNLMGLNPSWVVEHGDTYIRCPADGSILNLKITKTTGKRVIERL